MRIYWKDIKKRDNSVCIRHSRYTLVGEGKKEKVARSYTSLASIINYTSMANEWLYRTDSTYFENGRSWILMLWIIAIPGESYNKYPITGHEGRGLMHSRRISSNVGACRTGNQILNCKSFASHNYGILCLPAPEENQISTPHCSGHRHVPTMGEYIHMYECAYVIIVSWISWNSWGG